MWPQYRTMKRVGVRELKNRLSRYLKEAAQGEAIEVTDRGRVLAVIRSPQSTVGLPPREIRYQELVAEGTLIPASHPWDTTWIEETRPLLGAGESLALLDELRGE